MEPCYTSVPRLVNFDTGSPWDAKILKGVKKIVTLFRDEIWHSEGHWCVADLDGFWWTVHFFGSKNFRHRIFRTLLYGWWRNLATLGVWLIDTYFPTFVNLGLGVPRYHIMSYLSIHCVARWLCRAAIKLSVQVPRIAR